MARPWIGEWINYKHGSTIVHPDGKDEDTERCMVCLFVRVYVCVSYISVCMCVECKYARVCGWKKSGYSHLFCFTSYTTAIDISLHNGRMKTYNHITD